MGNCTIGKNGRNFPCGKCEGCRRENCEMCSLTIFKCLNCKNPKKKQKCKQKYCPEKEQLSKKLLQERFEISNHTNSKTPKNIAKASDSMQNSSVNESTGQASENLVLSNKSDSLAEIPKLIKLDILPLKTYIVY